MDLSVLNLYSGKLEFLKVGACPTYIKKENKVEIIKSESLPVGILNDADIDLYNTDLVSGDILVMITDGILESNSEVVNKEEALKEMLKNITTDNPQKIADLIIGESVDNDFGYAKDDMTVMVVKIVEK
jgi:Serine phosphatase RsbU, regulator of sigma subunit